MSLKNYLKGITMLSALLVAPWCNAGSGDSNKGVKALPPTEIQESIKKQFPDVDLNNIKPSPIPGLYEVIRGPTVIYISQDGRYAVSGDIIDIYNNFYDITEDARQKARVQAINNISKDHMIIYAPAKPKYTITVFTDVDCTYCRKFHDNIDEYNKLGIAVQYLAFPREGIGSETYKKSVNVWCAKDKKAAFALAKSDKKLEEVKCANEPVDDEFKLGMMMGVRGTPTIVLDNGLLIPGYLTPNKLLEAIEEVKKAEKELQAKKEAKQSAEKK